MKINWRMQSKHIANGMDRWIELQEVEKDICFLFHQIEPYRGIMGDLNYSEFYSRPYWLYLDLSTEEDQDGFIRDGCLLMILCMAMEMIDGTGFYLQPHIATCRWKLEEVEPPDERVLKLLTVVRTALDYAESGQPESSELTDGAHWAYEEVVAKYFRDRAQPNRPEM